MEIPFIHQAFFAMSKERPGMSFGEFIRSMEEYVQYRQAEVEAEARATAGE